MLTQSARKAREAAGVAWAPRFFAPGAAPGTWALKLGVEEALSRAAATMSRGGEQQAPLQPATPRAPLRRSLTGE
jgi:hypothetical protein